MTRIGELIYGREAEGPAAAKAESHAPRIELLGEVKRGEPFRVKVSVGPHPNRPEHSIRWVALYFREEGRPFNPVRLVEVEFEPGYAEPVVEATLRLDKPGTLYALAYCNLHGIWESSVEVRPQ